LGLEDLGRLEAGPPVVGTPTHVGGESQSVGIGGTAESTWWDGGEMEADVKLKMGERGAGP